MVRLPRLPTADVVWLPGWLLRRLGKFPQSALAELAFRFPGLLGAEVVVWLPHFLLYSFRLAFPGHLPQNVVVWVLGQLPQRIWLGLLGLLTWRLGQAPGGFLKSCGLPS